MLSVHIQHLSTDNHLRAVRSTFEKPFPAASAVWEKEELRAGRPDTNICPQPALHHVQGARQEHGALI